MADSSTIRMRSVLWLSSGVILAIALAAPILIPASGQQPPTRKDSSGQNPPVESRAEAGKQSNTGSPASSGNAQGEAKASGAAAGSDSSQKPAGNHPSATPPRKIVVRQGGVDEPVAQIVPGMSAEEAARLRREAEQRLNAAAEALTQIDSHKVDSGQQETVSQIHNYMAGAGAALKEGDISRAHTLALKADLLAEDLAKH